MHFAVVPKLVTRFLTNYSACAWKQAISRTKCERNLTWGKKKEKWEGVGFMWEGICPLLVMEPMLMLPLNQIRCNSYHNTPTHKIKYLKKAVTTALWSITNHDAINPIRQTKIWRCLSFVWIYVIGPIISILSSFFSNPSSQLLGCLL